MSESSTSKAILVFPMKSLTWGLFILSNFPWFRSSQWINKQNFLWQHFLNKIYIKAPGADECKFCEGNVLCVMLSLMVLCVILNRDSVQTRLAAIHEWDAQCKCTGGGWNVWPVEVQIWLTLVGYHTVFPLQPRGLSHSVTLCFTWWENG